MNNSDPYHLLGKFIYIFQHLEDSINEIIHLLVQAKDQEMSRILVAEMDNSARLKIVDVLFQRFTSVRAGICTKENKEFHKLISSLQKLGTRRNEIVHSKYYNWTNSAGEEGLLRENSRLRASKGVLEKYEEELLPKDLWSDLTKLTNVYSQLEVYRLKVIDWLQPVESA
jgi:hypothetical protein